MNAKSITLALGIAALVIPTVSMADTGEAQFNSATLACIQGLIQQEVAAQAPWAATDHLIISSLTGATSNVTAQQNQMYQDATEKGIASEREQYTIAMVSDHSRFSGTIEVGINLTAALDARFGTVTVNPPTCRIDCGGLRISNTANGATLASYAPDCGDGE